jgi:hypothetical protein
MGKKAAVTMDLGLAVAPMSQALVVEAPGLRLELETGARRAKRSRIAAAWSHHRDLARQRADLSKSPGAGLGRDTGCRV